MSLIGWFNAQCLQWPVIFPPYLSYDWLPLCPTANLLFRPYHCKLQHCSSIAQLWWRIGPRGPNAFFAQFSMPGTFCFAFFCISSFKCMYWLIRDWTRWTVISRVTSLIISSLAHKHMYIHIYFHGACILYIFRYTLISTICMVYWRKSNIAYNKLVCNLFYGQVEMLRCLFTYLCLFPTS